MLVYQLEGVRINDSWYCKEGDTYHSFFLEYGDDQPKEYMWEKQVCGHMMSKDLIHWEYAGNALKAEVGTWNDLGIATGSVAKYNGRWYMMFTANSVLYIAKVLKDPVGKDVIMINNVPYGVVGPYAVEYCTDDTIKIIS